MEGDGEGALGGEGAKGQKPVDEGEGEHGLGTKTDGLDGPDDESTAPDADSPGGAEDGPVKGEESEPGGGDATGPTPDGVPQEGGTESDPDSATGSTE